MLKVSKGTPNSGFAIKHSSRSSVKHLPCKLEQVSRPPKYKMRLLDQMFSRPHTALYLFLRILLQQIWLFLKALRENLFQASLLNSDSCQQPLAFLGYRCISAVSVSVFPCSSPSVCLCFNPPLFSLIRTLVSESRAHPISRMTSSWVPELDDIYKDSISQVPFTGTNG